MDNLFNTDSGFRPPSPLTFSSAPGPGLFGDSLGFEDFRFANQDFLNMSAAAVTSSSSGQPGGEAAPPLLPGMMMGNSDPSMQLFNSSEQRYFSEFLDTLVVDQDFTFDPSAIPNLPNLPLFSQDVVMPGGFNMDINNPYRIPGVQAQQQQTPQLPSQQQQQPCMDYDMSSGGHSFIDKQSSVYTQQQQQHHPISVPAKRTKTNKGGASTSTSSASIDNPTRRGTPSSRPSSLDAHTVAQDPTGNRIATPIQQLSKLSLNQSAAQAVAATTSSTKAKKNKREEEDPAQPGSSNSSNLNRHSPTSRSQPYDSHHQQQSQHKEGSRDRNTSMSDEDGGSDSPSGTKASASAGAGGPSSTVTPKRKPYKELLTEEEKRANHIASEQKRRNTIRNGFKDMTDIIPDLKDVNSSKSTILFKAVDFIKHLERRNRLLQEKATQLESRLLMQKGGGGGAGGSNGHQQQIQSQAQAQQHHAQQQHSSSSYRTSPYDTHHPQQPQHGVPLLSHQQQHHQQQQLHNQHHSHLPTHHHPHQQQQHHHSQPLYHSSGLDDKRLQEIPNFYPVSISR
ncbi:hypothetical protein BGZ95_009980 [Linnemannia exigua]|uniref:BHLH domain-containing protein n=1 Tax=Linnemannia exigua TaxID=604196 RepID=A0AAD4H7H1_9FUNG|nr:hypothetical protein BGZ95_009980 [Linnemannia exigua]